MTVALCGHWEHEGPCRWPHNSQIENDGHNWALRTIIVVPNSEKAHVTALVEGALRDDERWDVVAIGTSPITDAEQSLAARLSTLSE